MPLRIFIADLHLRADMPQGLALFADFLQHFGTDSELYVLGDLFDLWLGDDLDLPRYASVTQALGAYAKRGGRTLLMVGNHDFLLGEGFFSASGALPLADPYLLEHAGRRLLLTHGDALCTADVDYQAFRARIRAPAFVAEFLTMPAERRQAMASEFQEGSRSATAQKDATVMQVDAVAADAALRDSGADILLHGHTHRPGVHRLPMGRRVVLGPWHGRESALVWPPGEPPRMINMDCDAAELGA